MHLHNAFIRNKDNNHLNNMTMYYGSLGASIFRKLSLFSFIDSNDP